MTATADIKVALKIVRLIQEAMSVIQVDNAPVNMPRVSPVYM